MVKLKKSDLAAQEPRQKIISPSARTPNQKRYIQAIEKYDMVVCEGPAGCGKTHLAIGMAINFLLKGMVNKIVVARPVVEVGEQLGFLPGDIDNKMDPYVRPAFDELEEFLGVKEITKLKADRILDIVPIAFMRGRTFKDSFIVCDECQNLEYDQMKMLLTRLGSDSRMVLTGDIAQSDLRKRNRGAFQFTYDLFEKDDEIGTVQLNESDIQRHRLVGKVVKKWEKAVDLYRDEGRIEE